MSWTFICADTSDTSSQSYFCLSILFFSASWPIFFDMNRLFWWTVAQSWSPLAPSLPSLVPSHCCHRREDDRLRFRHDNEFRLDIMCRCRELFFWVEVGALGVVLGVVLYFHRHRANASLLFLSCIRMKAGTQFVLIDPIKERRL